MQVTHTLYTARPAPTRNGLLQEDASLIMCSAVLAEYGLWVNLQYMYIESFYLYIQVLDLSYPLQCSNYTCASFSLYKKKTPLI